MVSLLTHNGLTGIVLTVQNSFVGGNTALITMKASKHTGMISDWVPKLQAAKTCPHFHRLGDTIVLVDNTLITPEYPHLCTPQS